MKCAECPYRLECLMLGRSDPSLHNEGCHDRWETLDKLARLTNQGTRWFPNQWMVKEQRKSNE